MFANKKKRNGRHFSNVKTGVFVLYISKNLIQLKPGRNKKEPAGYSSSSNKNKSNLR